MTEKKQVARHDTLHKTCVCVCVSCTDICIFVIELGWLLFFFFFCEMDPKKMNICFNRYFKLRTLPFFKILSINLIAVTIAWPVFPKDENDIYCNNVNIKIYPHTQIYLQKMIIEAVFLLFIYFTIYCVSLALCRFSAPLCPFWVLLTTRNEWYFHLPFKFSHIVGSEFFFGEK